LIHVEHQTAGVFCHALVSTCLQAQEMKTKNKTEMKNKKLIEGLTI